MDAITNKLANALNDLYLECRAQGLTSRDGYMDEASMILQEYRDLVGKEIAAATDAQADMADEPQDLASLLLVTGDPSNGFRFIGPFHTHDDASNHALSMGDAWWICDIDAPEEN